MGWYDSQQDCYSLGIQDRHLGGGLFSFFAVVAVVVLLGEGGLFSFIELVSYFSFSYTLKSLWPLKPTCRATVDVHCLLQILAAAPHFSLSSPFCLSLVGRAMLKSVCWGLGFRPTASPCPLPSSPHPLLSPLPLSLPCGLGSVEVCVLWSRLQAHSFSLSSPLSSPHSSPLSLSLSLVGWAVLKSVCCGQGFRPTASPCSLPSPLPTHLPSPSPLWAGQCWSLCVVVKASGPQLLPVLSPLLSPLPFPLISPLSLSPLPYGLGSVEVSVLGSRLQAHIFCPLPHFLP